LSGASLMGLQPARGDASVVGFGGSARVVLMQRRATVGLKMVERRSDGEEGRRTGNGRHGQTREMREKQDNKGNMGGGNGGSYGRSEAMDKGGRRAVGWRWATIARFRAQRTHHPYIGDAFPDCVYIFARILRHGYCGVSVGA
jgi:hypothetical protein